MLGLADSTCSHRQLPALDGLPGINSDPLVYWHPFGTNSHAWLSPISLRSVENNSKASNIRFNRPSKTVRESRRRWTHASQRRGNIYGPATASLMSTICSFANNPDNFDSPRMVEDLLSILRDRLKKSQVYKVCVVDQHVDSVKKLIRQSFLPSNSNMSLEINQIVDNQEKINFFLKQCAAGKLESIAAQEYLVSLPPSELAQYSQAMEVHLESLITDKYANYVLQKTALLDDSFRSNLENFCKHNFPWLLPNEYASRVMQVLAEHSDHFRHFCLTHFRSHSVILQSEISAAFLAATAIRFSKSQTEIGFFGEMIELMPSLIKNKYFKRIIVSYIEKCDTVELCRTFARLKISGRVRHKLDDKYFTYIILMFVQRGCPLMLAELKEAVQREPLRILRTKHFGFLVTKLIERQDKAITLYLQSLFLQLPNHFIKSLFDYGLADLAVFVVYALVSTLERAPRPIQHAKLVAMVQDLRRCLALDCSGK